MRLRQNTYGVDKNFLITLAKIARVPTNNLQVKVQRSHQGLSSSGICFAYYPNYRKPFIGMRIGKGSTPEEIGKLWLHELSHHRDNQTKQELRKRGLFVRGKRYGGEKKASKFAERMWNRYLEKTGA